MHYLEHSLCSDLWMREQVSDFMYSLHVSMQHMHCVCVFMFLWSPLVSGLSSPPRFNDRPPLLDASSVYFLFSFPFCSFHLFFLFLSNLFPPDGCRGPCLILSLSYSVCVCVWWNHRKLKSPSMWSFDESSLWSVFIFFPVNVVCVPYFLVCVLSDVLYSTLFYYILLYSVL